MIEFEQKIKEKHCRIGQDRIKLKRTEDQYQIIIQNQIKGVTVQYTIEWKR